MTRSDGPKIFKLFVQSEIWNVFGFVPVWNENKFQNVNISRRMDIVFFSQLEPPQPKG